MQLDFTLLMYPILRHVRQVPNSRFRYVMKGYLCQCHTLKGTEGCEECALGQIIYIPILSLSLNYYGDFWCAPTGIGETRTDSSGSTPKFVWGFHGAKEEAAGKSITMNN